MSRVDPNLVGDSDLGYDPFVDDDAELRGGFMFAWMKASINSQAHVNNSLKPPSGGGGGGHGGGGGGGGTVPPTQALAAYAGPNFTSVGQVSGYYMIPPDSASAISTQAAILATNGEVQVWARSGATGLTLTKGLDTSLDKFFGATGTFDPRVIYDPNSGKLIVVAVDQNSTNHTSHIWLAVSTDATATHFNVSSINTSIGVGASNTLSWADFPQVGLDNQGNLYLTASMFGFTGGTFQGSRLWVVNENSVGPATIAPTPVDPSIAAGFGSELFSLTPATATGSAGEYLVAYNSAKLGNGHNALDIAYVDGAGLWHSSVIDVGAIDSNGTYGGLTAPQPGTSQLLDADDSRTASVVYKNGYLYVAANILPSSGPDAGHTTVHWWVLSTDGSGNPVTVVNQGDISGNTFQSGSNLRSYYASLAVDDNGNMAVSFSGSGPTNGTSYTGYASAYEVTVANAAHTGAHEVGGWQLLESGVASYYRTFGGADNRWGDYSSISNDPSNPGHFWAFNEYAMTQGTTLQGQSGQWATEFGYF